jgi:hypothetical protein
MRWASSKRSSASDFPALNFELFAANAIETTGQRRGTKYFSR